MRVLARYVCGCIHVFAYMFGDMLDKARLLRVSISWEQTAYVWFRLVAHRTSYALSDIILSDTSEITHLVPSHTCPLVLLSRSTHTLLPTTVACHSVVKH